KIFRGRADRNRSGNRLRGPAKRSRIRSGKTARAEFGVEIRLWGAHAAHVLFATPSSRTPGKTGSRYLFVNQEERLARPPIAAREPCALPRCARTEFVVTITLHIRGVA